MIYLLVPFVVPIVIYLLLPWLTGKLTHKHLQRNMLLLVACIVYFLSWYLPSPLIQGQNTSFTTHFIGGGVFSGFVWLYLKQEVKWKSTSIIELLSLFAFVSAFGVLNELFELVIVQLHLVKKLNITDTSWDLLANTIGGLAFWLIYQSTAYIGQGKK